MERKEQRIINKIFKLLILVISLFTIFGNINCRAVSLSDMEEKAIDDCFGESEPISTTQFLSNDDDTGHTESARLGIFVYAMVAIIIICAGIVFLYMCLDTLINSIKAKKIKIRMGCLKVLLFLCVLAAMTYISGFCFVILERKNVELYIDKYVATCIMSILFTILVYGVISVIVKFVKALIKKEPIKTNWLTLFLSIAVVLCVGIILIWIYI